MRSQDCGRLKPKLGTGCPLLALRGKGWLQPERGGPQRRGAVRSPSQRSPARGQWVGELPPPSLSAELFLPQISLQDLLPDPWPH